MISAPLVVSFINVFFLNVLHKSIGTNQIIADARFKAAAESWAKVNPIRQSDSNQKQWHLGQQG